MQDFAQNPATSPSAANTAAGALLAASAPAKIIAYNCFRLNLNPPMVSM